MGGLIVYQDSLGVETRFVSRIAVCQDLFVCVCVCVCVSVCILCVGTCFQKVTDELEDVINLL
jgi:hypothetical protein